MLIGGIIMRIKASLLVVLVLVGMPASARAADVHLNPTPPSAPACSNWFDDDGDGFKDFQDIGCSGSTDTDEANAVPAPVNTAGDVRPAAAFQSNWDAFITAAVNDTASPFPQQDYLRRFERARVWQNLPVVAWPADRAYAANASWMPRGWTYRNGMAASYRGDPLVADDYYLWSGPPSDSNRKRLYINFQCGGGSCPQYAADLGYAPFRQRYVDGLRAHVAESGGAFMDDVNFGLSRAVSNGSGQFVRPWNPRTGAPMTGQEWRASMLQLVKDVKAAFPSSEVAINTVYFPGGVLSKPETREALDIADGWEFERGFGDTGVVAGGGTFGFDTIKAAIDYAHQVGAFVIHDIQSTALSNTYTEAAYLCTNGGRDYYSRPEMAIGDSITPPAWNSAWDLNLGAATSSCTKGADGVYRRTFERGSVTLDPSARTASIG